ncbi:hypothetical protein PIB30_033208 [Stylosanthes scabra]|uniref:Uncharacterized protein n=1 Tax=Stylosanthes scabra TaxID=79078 RepID=A0ABU6SCM4_9FABA|nr:hypothetical protein [Stylosanthes scabra]
MTFYACVTYRGRRSAETYDRSESTKKPATVPMKALPRRRYGRRLRSLGWSSGGGEWHNGVEGRARKPPILLAAVLPWNHEKERRTAEARREREMCAAFVERTTAQKQAPTASPELAGLNAAAVMVRSAIFFQERLGLRASAKVQQGTSQVVERLHPLQAWVGLTITQAQGLE